MAVVKIIEVLGSSPTSMEEAVQDAVSQAAKTVRGINGVDVLGWTAEVKDGKVTNWKADVKLAFVVER